MAELGAVMPWRVWFKLHTKAVCQAIPMALLIVLEARDNYFRATWQVQNIHPEQFHTGDVVAICNRWYTLPTWQHVLYSFLTKTLLKSAWDDVGIIAMDNGKPNLLYVDFDGTHLVPLDEFIRSRHPRGVAVRRLQLDDGVPPLATSVAEVFTEEASKIPVKPWYLFSASLRTGAEHRYYNMAVGMNAQRQLIRSMFERQQSTAAINHQKEKLRDMEVMRKHLAEFVEPTRTFHLFNGSLVASFLAAYGLLDRTIPQPCHYLPQDFACDIPFVGATRLEEPVVFFKS